VGVLLEMRKAFSVISIPFQLRDFISYKKREKKKKVSTYQYYYTPIFFITGIGCISNNLVFKKYFTHTMIDSMAGVEI
jgi:hypothetical protein